MSHLHTQLLSKKISEVELHAKNFHLHMKQGIYNHSRVNGDAQNHLSTLTQHALKLNITQCVQLLV